MKRIISVLMLVCLLMSLGTVSAFAANEATVTNDDELKGALMGAYDTIVLDGPGPFNLFWPNHAVTVKFNSAISNVTLPVDFVDGGTLTVIDSNNGVAPVAEDTDNGDNSNVALSSTDGLSIEDIFAQGGNLVLSADINVEDTSLVVAIGATLTIDLAGHSITGQSNVKEHHAMITNKGNLTITDSVGGGKISYTYTGEGDANYGVGCYTIDNHGSLTVNGGTVANYTAPMSHASYAINNNSCGSASAYLTINGGSVINNNNTAIRQFVGGPNHLTVTGGSITGTRAVWLQLAGSSGNPEARLSVSGGTLSSKGSSNNLAVYSYSYGASFESTSINISGGTFNGNVATGAPSSSTAEEVTITGGTFNSDYVYSYASANNTSITGGTFSEAAKKYVKAYIASGYDLIKNSSGSYDVGKAAAASDETGIQNAVTSSGNAVVITLARDTAVSNPIEVAANKTVEIAVSGGTFDNQLSLAAGNTEGLFTLEPGASVRITGVEGTAAELAKMREMVSEKYCVSKGSILIKESHTMVNGRCVDCDPASPYAGSYVPATGDMSNMPLWTILFIGFAAVALLTKKKKA